MENVVRVDQSTGVSRTSEDTRSEVERLHREHNELKARLSELNSRLYLSPEEEVERKTIQKLKLIKKDRLAFLTRS
jgi:hypothetical protein